MYFGYIVPTLLHSQFINFLISRVKIEVEVKVKTASP